MSALNWQRESPVSLRSGLPTSGDVIYWAFNWTTEPKSDGIKPDYFIHRRIELGMRQKGDWSDLPTPERLDN